ncbi:cytochrome c biogenesis protein CcdA [Frisingicoccus sp.]|uniref:redoxin family protein n=1 Tax=Frisingicoccus sp. TaxID=1918627 RepID=UPI003AB4ACD7
MNFNVETGIPFITVFIQGLLSFFSPCILPLVPLYISYLAGGMYRMDENGRISYPRKKVLLHTLFFILGIGFAFILMGLGFTAIGRFFSGNKVWFTRIGGLIMIGFGLYQLGVFGKSQSMEQTHRLPFSMEGKTFGPFMALLLGFTFSFAWTPCVGPVLAGVLLMASSAATAVSGFALIGVYMAGFVLPFLAVGIFAGAALDFFNRRRQVIQYTVKIGGVLLILMGVMTMTGWMNGITGYLSGLGADSRNEAALGETSQTASEAVNTSEAKNKGEISETEAETAAETSGETEENGKQTVAAPDFTLVDQFGNSHTLSEYKGKTVFLNFWATWCGPCRMEMPYIQKVYEEYGSNGGDVIILGVANPKTEEYPNNSDVSQEEVELFLSENGYTYPVVMDLDGSIFAAYGIQAFPTTFMIDKNGNVYGYAPGSLSEDMVRSIIRQTVDSVENN